MSLNAEQTQSQKGLIEYIKSTFADCPDGRKGKNCQYAVSDAILTTYPAITKEWRRVPLAIA